MNRKQSTHTFTAYYPRQCLWLGTLITLVIWLGAWLLTDKLAWPYAVAVFAAVVVIMTLGTCRTFVLSGNRLYRGKACAKVLVDLEHAKRATFEKSPSPLLRDDLILLIMDPRLNDGVAGRFFAVGNFRSALAAEFTEAIERRIAASRAAEEA